MGIFARTIATIAVILVFGAGFGCSGSFRTPALYRYFTAPSPDDAWSRKIRLWQVREKSADTAGTPANVAGSGSPDAGPSYPAADTSLKVKYDSYRSERKRGIARDFAAWLQGQARNHYVPDGPVDHWATLEETFRSNGEDCDGLELLTYHFLLDLGFGDDEVYRAIVYRRSDGQHHMVTLWFENPDDPWVIDPTGAMTTGMPRMSSMPDWVPLKVFTEDRDFTVLPQTAQHSSH
jgi:hypothetical protein